MAVNLDTKQVAVAKQEESDSIFLDAQIVLGAVGGIAGGAYLSTSNNTFAVSLIAGAITRLPENFIAILGAPFVLLECAIRGERNKRF